ncbi:ATP-binding cassette domain-containing protein [Profundibacter sp.]
MSNVLHLDISLGFEGYSLTAKADIPMQGITALEGVSGSGKTTLLRSIAGLERRAAGVIRFGASDWQSDGVFISPQRRRIGYVFQDTRLFKHLDVAQNLAYGHKRAGAGAEVLERVIEALDLSGLLKRRIGGLSGGEKQRVAIGRALALDPQLLLLDEPMSGLDQARKDEILPYIARAVQTMGCPAIYVSHERRETAMLADYIINITDGALLGPVKCENVLHCMARPSSSGDDLVIFVGERETRMPATGPLGAHCDVRINGASLLLTAHDPGVSTALMTLPATLASIDAIGGGRYRLVLEGEGWRIGIIRPKHECNLAGMTQGQSLWLLVMDASAYPAGV